MVNSILGRGSDSRRKRIINDKFSNDILFEALMKTFRNRFNVLADNLQVDIKAVVERHLNDIQRTLDIVRNENAASENEQDPEFRSRVEAEIRIVNDGVQRVQARIDP